MSMWRAVPDAMGDARPRGFGYNLKNGFLFTEETIMKTTKPNKTISQVFEEFLADQKPRISHKTYRSTRASSSFTDRTSKATGQGMTANTTRSPRGGGTFCGTFGPEDATAGYSEFLGYFMPRKVMCGKDTMQAAGTVTKKAGEVAGRQRLRRRIPRTPRSERAKRRRICPTPGSARSF